MWTKNVIWGGDELKNDFDRSVFEHQPMLRDIKAELDAGGGEYASMSGSGSSMYGIFDSAIMAEQLKDKFGESEVYLINL